MRPILESGCPFWFTLSGTDKSVETGKKGQSRTVWWRMLRYSSGGVQLDGIGYEEKFRPTY